MMPTDKCIGYWHDFLKDDGYPVPKIDSATPGQIFLMLTHLKHFISLSTLQHYKGSSQCRICGEANGSSEHVLAKNGIRIRIPFGLKHYIVEHNVLVPELLSLFDIGKLNYGHEQDSSVKSITNSNDVDFVSLIHTCPEIPKNWDEEYFRMLVSACAEIPKENVKLQDDAFGALRKYIVTTMSNLTPAAMWRTFGFPDPHGDIYCADRAMLCKGGLTDDEIANAVFLNPSIVNLTAAKERIRWLSRMLQKQIDLNTAESEKS